MEKCKSKLNIVMVMLAVLLTVSVLSLCIGMGDILAAGDTERQTVTINLSNRNLEENVKFEANNMFPGDSQTQFYRVIVAFENLATVHFGVEVEEGYEKLGEVLQLRVVLLESEREEILYEGSINDLVSSLEHTLAPNSGEKTEELCYEIEAYLETDVTNEYQGKILLADFSWWIEETSDSPENDNSGDSSGSEESGNSSETDDMDKGVVSPETGDESNMMLWFGTLCLSFVVLLVFVLRKKKVPIGCAERVSMQGWGSERRHTAGRFYGRMAGGIAVIVILMLCLGILTFALGYHIVTVEKNLFETGRVSINVNGGEPVIAEEEFLFEPGMTVVKNFYLENTGTCDVYYRLYFTNIEGELSNVLEVTVQDGDKILYSGIPSKLKRSVDAADDLLKEGEKRELTVSFHMPEKLGSEIEGSETAFDLEVEAVQAVNNPDGLFD